MPARKPAPKNPTTAEDKASKPKKTSASAGGSSPATTEKMRQLQNQRMLLKNRIQQLKTRTMRVASHAEKMKLEREAASLEADLQTLVAQIDGEPEPSSEGDQEAG